MTRESGGFTPDVADVLADLRSTAWGIRTALNDPNNTEIHAKVPLILLRAWLNAIEAAREYHPSPRQAYASPLALETMRVGLSPLAQAGGEA